MTLEDKQEPTVEQCLQELREMFPQTYISLTATAIWFADETKPGANYNIVLGAHRYEFFGKTLLEAMAQVRTWYAEHRKMGHDSGKEVE